MTRLVLPDLTIRIWREESNDTDVIDNTDLKDDIGRLLLPGQVTLVQLAEKILTIERVNAVEVLDKNFQGIIVYRDWP